MTGSISWKFITGQLDVCSSLIVAFQFENCRTVHLFEKFPTLYSPLRPLTNQTTLCYRYINLNHISVPNFGDRAFQGEYSVQGLLGLIQPLTAWMSC